MIEAERSRKWLCKKGALDVEKRRLTAMEEQVSLMNKILMTLVKKSD